MTKPPNRPRDLNQWAKHMVDLTTGQTERPNKETVPRPKPPKKPSTRRKAKTK